MIVVYDLETLKDFFLYIDVSLSEDKFNVFEISKIKNDIIPLLNHIRSTKLAGQIGFNNLNFDAQVQQYIINKGNYWFNLTGEEIANEIHSYVQYIIDKSNRNEWLDYSEKDFSIRQVDLYKIWHFDNKAKMTSLKWLQYMTDWHNIEDMPIDHLISIDRREIADQIISYCKNDCLSTKHFYNITRGKTEHPLYKDIDKLQLRKDIKEEFGFTCTNFNDVKIGDEINKVNYLKATGISKYDLKEKKAVITPFTFEDCFPTCTKFLSRELNDFINSIRKVKVSLENKQEFHFKFGSTKYVLAKGGLHSEDKPRLIIPKNYEILRDADIGSMYPNTIRKRKIYPRGLGEKWLEGYTGVIEKRLEAKKKFKETKDKKYQSIQEAFKLALNGGSFGKLQDKSNWQYDPFACFQVTIGGQIDLLMLIERLELSGIRVMSANTDGIVSLFDKNQEETYNKVCKEWEILVGNNDLGQLEYADYKLLAQRSVNHYIAIKMNGEVKHKGEFSIHHEMHRNKSYRVIPLALDAFYSKGLNPRTFITNHINIFDFCAGMRTKGEWRLEAVSLDRDRMKRERLQKTNRYFISNKGVKLVKCHPDGREIQEDAGRWMATIYNKHVEKDIKEYDINYDFYIRKTYEIIGEIQPEITDDGSEQLSLF